MKLPIASIAVINRQRKLMDRKALEELAQSIQSNGLLHPIVVRLPHEDERGRIGDTTYVLCVGGRRLAAHMLLKLDAIEANLKESLDALSAEICELEENVVREDITHEEEVAARTRIHEIRKQQNPTQTIEQTAGELNITKGQLSRDLQLADAIKKDPSLKGASSKGSALRMMKHKAQMTERSETARKVVGSDLTQKLLSANGSDFIRTIPDRSVNLVFSDLPYGFDYFETVKSGENMKGQYDDSIDTSKDFITDIVPQMLRVVKPKGWIVLFMGYELHAWLQNLLSIACTVHADYRASKFSIHCLKGTDETCRFLKPELPPWIWTRRGKGNHGHYPELHASNRYEMIVVVNGGEAHLTKKPVENVLDFEPLTGTRLHAMQKPHDLCCEIIERTTVPGELVLDVCMGSGAHLAAAAAKGRDFLGCDNNPENLSAALSLVGQHYHRGVK